LNILKKELQYVLTKFLDGKKDTIVVEFSEEAKKLQMLVIEKQDQFISSFGPFLKNSLDKQWNLEVSSKSTQAENDEFRALVLYFYGMSQNNVPPLPVNVSCHLLNVALPLNLVAVAHIFPKRFRHNYWVPIADIDDVQNTLVLFRPIERAFDRGQLCFVWINDQKKFRIHILDPKLHTTTISKLAEQCFPRTQTGWMSLDNSLLKSSFGQFHGQFLNLQQTAMPYKRCLAFHAHRARFEAINKKWIGANDLNELDDDEIWSPGFMEDKKLFDLVTQWKDFE